MYELVRSLILVLFWMVLVSANDANDFNGAISRKNAEIAFLQEKLTKDPNSFMTAIELGQVFQSKARLT
ncbi:MAG TPA: hypothetical protein VHP63_07185, partial [candidate division Zixibacteria bacterium]|nr:hypothetical protein [candidate division Zixibacteria bacterium]